MCSDHRGNIAPFLHSNRRNTRQRFPALHESSSITDHKDIRILRHREVTHYLYTSRTVYLCVEPFTSWGGCNTCSPNHSFSRKVLTRYGHSLIIDMFHRRLCFYFNTKMIESFFCCVSQPLGKSS